MLGTMQDWPLRLTRLIDHAAREAGAREIVSIDAAGAETRTSWAGIAHDARRLAQALVRLGVRPGERVATLAMNHHHHLAAWWGAIGMGAVVHTLNWRLFDDQIAWIANHAEDRVLLYDRAFAPVVDRLRDRLPAMRLIGLEDELDALIAAEDGDWRWAAPDERAPAMLCYTSGTTGHPKGVLYEHRTTLLHALAMLQPDAFGLARASVAMPVTPLFHAGAWGLPFCAAAAGAKLVLSAQADPALIHRMLAEERVTHLAGVPSVWLMLCQHLDRTGGDFAALEVVITGGSAAPRALIERLHRAGVRFCHLWGMTETSPVATVAARTPDWAERSEASRADHVARQGGAAFGIELRVIDDAGRIAPRDGVTPGRLQVRGAWVVERYHGEAALAVDADGWFDTGDVAVIHPDHAMQITDRAKDVIKSGGEWISSVELENEAVGCPGVAEAAAIGVPHPRWDERPLLLVVRAPGAAVDAGAVRAHLAARVARWWLPDEILFVDALPHTGTGKLLKTALRDQYRDHRLPTA